MTSAASCPHCGVVADVDAHRALGFRCRVCGGPRVVVDVPEVSLGAPTSAALKEAGREHTKHWLLTAAGSALLGAGALGLLVAAVVVLAAAPGLVATLATFLGASIPLLAGTWTLRSAATARHARDEALRNARLGALHDAQAVLGQLDGARIAELMRLDVEQAELLSAEASVASLLEQAALPRVRVAATAPPLADDPLASEEPSVMTERRDTER